MIPLSPPLTLEKSFLRSMKSFVRLLIEFVSRIRINIVPPIPNTRNIFISWMDIRIILVFSFLEMTRSHYTLL